jgi:hypothetical protein
MYYIVVGIVCTLAGFVTGYFVIKNNPKYLNLDDMAKAKRDEFLKKVEDWKKRIGH